MIGLEFICRIYNKEYKEVAALMGITPQYINAWLREKRKIPPDRLEQFSKIFPNIPVEYFQKELTRAEKWEVQEIYLTVTDVFEDVEVPWINPDDGKEYVITETYSHHRGIIEHIRNERDKESLLERYEKMLEDGEDQYNNQRLLEAIATLIERGEQKYISVLKMIFNHVPLHDEELAFGGFDPFFIPPKQLEEMDREFADLLRKYNIIH